MNIADSYRIRAAQYTWARRITPLLSLVLMISMLMYVVVPAAGAGSTIPRYGVKVAGERVGEHSSWGIWLFGRHGKRCWAVRNMQGDIGNVEAYCGVSFSSKPWQLVARGSFNGNRRSMLFFLTRKDVTGINAEIEGKANRPSTWIHVDAQRLAWNDAHHAHLRRDFGYGVVTFLGPLGCIKRLSVLGKGGIRIGPVRQFVC
jgi:hypothetical protein